MSYTCFAMSGWGCCNQLDERCLLLRRECKPGMPGCVLHGKVLFISEVEAAPPRKKPRKRAKQQTGKSTVPGRPRRA